VSGGKLWNSDVGTIFDTKSVITELLGQASNVDIHITAYLFSDHHEFTPEIINLLKGCLDRFCRIWMIVDHLYKEYDDGGYQHPVDDLKKLNEHANFHLFNFDKEGDSAILHAKIIVVDRKEAFMGSANITNKAMQDNYEIGLQIRSGKHPGNLAKMVERIAYDKELCEEIS
tara:strand:+ start:5755 stop:6270 length:516 start_codon:yes stop_codon:yes gene_type:complete